MGPSKLPVWLSIWRLKNDQSLRGGCRYCCIIALDGGVSGLASERTALWLRRSRQRPLGLTPGACHCAIVHETTTHCVDNTGAASCQISCVFFFFFGFLRTVGLETTVKVPVNLSYSCRYGDTLRACRMPRRYQMSRSCGVVRRVLGQVMNFWFEYVRQLQSQTLCGCSQWFSHMDHGRQTVSPWLGLDHCGECLGY